MNRTQFNMLENRMRTIRLQIGRLSKFGLSTSYYLEELAVLENAARLARLAIESEEYQTKLEIDSEPFPRVDRFIETWKEPDAAA